MAEIHGAIGPAGGVSGGLGPVGGYSASIKGAVGPVSEGIRDGAVTTPKIADLAVTTAKIADAAVTISKLAAEVIDATLTVSGAAADAQATGAALALKAAAADLQTLQQTVAEIKTKTDALKAAANYGVLNALTQATAGVNVLDAAQGKALGDRLTTAEGDITTLDGRLDALGVFSTGTRTATTNNLGNISLAKKRSAILVFTVFADGYMCLPFLDSSGNWYAKVMSWSTTAYTPVTGTSVTVEYLYKTV